MGDSLEGTRRNSFFGKYYKYNALAPKFQTYEQIKELAKRKYVEK